MKTSYAAMDRESWLLLLALAILWGISFFLASVALRELTPFTVVLLRVVPGAVFLWPLLYRSGVAFPRTLRDWIPFTVMGCLNNIIPFSMFFIGQTMVTSSLASVLNATTPLFTILVLAAFGDERLSARRLVGVFIGLIGVAVLRGPGVEITGAQTIGMLLCLGGALSYGFSGWWGKRHLAGVPPLTSATLQLTSSSIIMAVIAGIVDRPWQLPMPGLTTWTAIIGLAALSTSLAYVVFYSILARAGPANVMLVTLLIPIPAILLGHFVLGEELTVSEVLGALIIGGALLIIDGRPLAWLRVRLA